MAEIMDGEFDVVAGVVRLLSAPQMTRDRLRDLHAKISSLALAATSPTLIVQEVERDLPGPLRRFVADHPGLAMGVIGVLLTIIEILVAHHDATRQRSLSDEDVARIIREVLADPGVQRPPQMPLPPPPPTTPPVPQTEQPPPGTEPGQSP